MPLSEESKKQVTAALDAYLEAHAAKDIDGVMMHLAPDYMGIGTGEHEKFFNSGDYRAQAMRDFEQSDRMSVENKRIDVRGEGSCAWCTAEYMVRVTIGGKEFHYNNARLTAVFLRSGDRWQLVQSHFSLPAAGQEVGKSFPGA